MHALSNSNQFLHLWHNNLNVKCARKFIELFIQKTPNELCLSSLLNNNIH